VNRYILIQGKTVSGEAALGSGFLVSKDGKIVTNLHVIMDMKTASVRLSNGDIFDSLYVLATDERRDLAIIQVPGFDLPVLELGNSDAVAVGEPLVIVGSPLGLEGSVTAGILSSVRDTGDGFRVLQTDAAVNPGNSGGPLVDNKGQAIGVVSFRLLSAEGLSFAIPINYVRGLLSGVHGPMTLDQMRNALSATKPAQTEDAPTLRETLDWLKEKLRLVGRVAWTESDKNGLTMRVSRFSRAWTLDSCAIVVGTGDVVRIDIPQLPRDDFVVTDRYTVSLRDVTGVFVGEVGNLRPESAFLSGDKSAYGVFFATSSTFVHLRNSNDPQRAPWSEKVKTFYLPFKDELLANRVRDAFQHAADLCHKKEVF